MLKHFYLPVPTADGIFPGHSISKTFKEGESIYEFELFKENEKKAYYKLTDEPAVVAMALKNSARYMDSVCESLKHQNINTKGIVTKEKGIAILLKSGNWKCEKKTIIEYIEFEGVATQKELALQKQIKELEREKRELKLKLELKESEIEKQKIEQLKTEFENRKQKNTESKISENATNSLLAKSINFNWTIEQPLSEQLPESKPISKNSKKLLLLVFIIILAVVFSESYDEKARICREYGNKNKVTSILGCDYADVAWKAVAKSKLDFKYLYDIGKISDKELKSMFEKAIEFEYEDIAKNILFVDKSLYNYLDSSLQEATIKIEKNKLKLLLNLRYENEQSQRQNYLDSSLQVAIKTKNKNMAIMLLNLNASAYFTDERDKTKYKIETTTHNNIIMAENLKFKNSNSYCFNDKSSNCEKYGRLYNKNTANWICPNGWKLPNYREFKDDSSLKQGGFGRYKEHYDYYNLLNASKMEYYNFDTEVFWWLNDKITTASGASLSNIGYAEDKKKSMLREENLYLYVRCVMN
jgi:uncharacterized protein (TIGR02145 family)